MPTPLTDAEATARSPAYLARRGALVPVAAGRVPLTPARRAEIDRRREQLLPFAAPQGVRP